MYVKFTSLEAKTQRGETGMKEISQETSPDCAATSKYVNLTLFVYCIFSTADFRKGLIDMLIADLQPIQK